MKKNKTLLIIIIVLLVVLVLGGGTFAYIYFGTDLLKTDKELFAKYILLLGDEEEGLNPKILSDYLNKKELTPYENNGSFSVNNEYTINAPTDLFDQEFKSVVDKSNETNITFAGKTDKINMLVEQDISINYSDTVKLPFKYKQDGDLYAIQSDILSPSYFAVENNNLQDFALKLGATDVTAIPNRIEPKVIESLEFTGEEKTHILNNYIMPIYNGLSEEKFSKVQNSDGGHEYTLTVTFEEAKNIMLQFLQTLSNDDMMLNKLNSIIQEMYGDSIGAITAQDIKNAIEELEGATVNQGNLEITVTEKNKTTTGIIINFNEEAAIINVEITKAQNASSILYEVNINISTEGVEKLKCSIQMSYDGVNTDSIAENINISISNPEMMNLSYMYNNIITFGNVSIEQLNNNVAVLNNYPAEQLQPFVVQLAYRIIETNSKQMQQIGYKEEFVNPMVMWIAGPTVYSFNNNNKNLIDRAEEAQSIYEQDKIYTEEATANVQAYVNELLSGENN